jgi:probable F420-dependent oxidoreductase
MYGMAELAVMIAGTHRIFGPDLRNLVSFVALAEEVGFDEFLLGDHVVMGSRLDAYPYGSFSYGDGELEIQPDEPWPEVLTSLAAAASVTQKIRLAPGVLLAPLRPAPLLAKTVATLDCLSGGRLSLGVGVGWQREEYAALGLDYRDAWGRADDTIRACRVLWAAQPASFASSSVSFTDIYCSPRPVQERIPIWFGGKCTHQMANRIAHLGDGWFPLTDDPEVLAAGIRMIRASYEAIGRDAADLGVRASIPLELDGSGHADLQRATRNVPNLLQAGVTSLWCAVTPRLGITTLRELRIVLDDLVSELRNVVVDKSQVRRD